MGNRHRPSEMPQQNTPDIGVDGWHVEAVAEAHQRPGRVAAEPGEAPEVRFRRGKASAFRHLQGARLQPTAPDLVAERIGDRFDLRQRGSGQRFDGRVAIDEPLINRNHPRDLRLVGEDL